MLETPTEQTAKSTNTADPLEVAASGEVGAESQAETDGFQLVIDALKLNGIDTIFGLPGIPITDLTRRAAGCGHARDLLPP